MRAMTNNIDGSVMAEARGKLVTNNIDGWLMACTMDTDGREVWEVMTTMIDSRGRGTELRRNMTRNLSFSGGEIC